MHRLLPALLHDAPRFVDCKTFAPCPISHCRFVRRNSSVVTRYAATPHANDRCMVRSRKPFRLGVIAESLTHHPRPHPHPCPFYRSSSAVNERSCHPSPPVINTCFGFVFSGKCPSSLAVALVVRLGTGMLAPRFCSTATIERM